jgi:hypothetical protein
MKIAECEFESVTPYSQSRHYKVEKLPRELAVDYEERTWRERCHVMPDGSDRLFIPPMAFANCLKGAAQYLALPVPGKGKTTYTKHFNAGVMVADPLILPLLKTHVEGEWLFLPSDGRRGGGSRVEKCFPLIREWKGKVTYYILDDILTKDVFEQVVRTSGNLIGIGRFRPQNWGYYGRFKLVNMEWVEDA